MIASARLHGDVEGTNARFAVYDENRHIRRVRIIPVDDYATLREAIEALSDGGRNLQTAPGRCACRRFPRDRRRGDTDQSPVVVLHFEIAGRFAGRALGDNQRFHGQRAGRPASEA